MTNEPQKKEPQLMQFYGVSTQGLNAVRIAMLQGGNTEDLDAVVSLPSLKRVLVTATVVGNYAKSSPIFSETLRASGLMNDLHKLAQARNANPEAQLPPLIADRVTDRAQGVRPNV